MTKLDKLVAKLLSGRRLTHREVKQILEAYGYELRQGRGSGIRFIKPGRAPLIYHVPHDGDGPLKPYILDEIIEALRKEL